MIRVLTGAALVLSSVLACSSSALTAMPCNMDAGIIDAAPAIDAGRDAGKFDSCGIASDCSEATNVCYKNVACESSRCTYELEFFGTLVSDPREVKGDCKSYVCDGLGNTVYSVDESDVPDDGNPCTVDFCIGETPHAIHPNQPDGTACDPADASKVCKSGVCTQ